MTARPWTDALARRPLLWLVLLTGLLLALLLAARLVTLADELRAIVQQSAEEANKTLTRVFVNENWNEVRPLLPAPGSGAEASRANPRVGEIDQIVRRFSQTTDVLKVKIYDLAGTTLYSSQTGQIGEDKSGNPGFQAAARGQTASELTRRGTFGSFDGELFQRDLVSTYVPVRVDGRLEAVLEIYSDRTASIAFLEGVTQRQTTIVLPAFIAVLAAMLAAGWLLQRLQSRRFGPLARAEPASPQRADAEGAGRSPRWLPGVDDPMARAIEDLQVEIADLRSGVDIASGPDHHTAALNRVRALAEELQGWLRTASDLAALRENRMGNPPQPFSLDELLDALVAVPARQAAARGVQFGVYRHPSPLGMVRGDASRIACLLGHLLAVSVSSTRSGRIDIKALRSPGGLRVDLIDSGTGWPQVHLDALAEHWDTGSLPDPTDAGLEGLRLVLCRGLAQALGGHADFRSTPDHGSRLSVDLPLEGLREAAGEA
jgi:signal transduction histidine kinase